MSVIESVRKWVVGSVVGSLCFLSGQVVAENKLPAADLVLTNGYIYTVDEKRSIAEAVAVKDGEILAVGTAVDIHPYIGEATDVRDLKGKMVLPGLHDMHIHALAAQQPRTCSFEAKPLTLDEMVPFLKDCFAKENKAEGEWLVAIAWNMQSGTVPTETYPNVRAALDAVSTTNPVVLWGYDGHAGAFNSAAFASPEVPINAETLLSVYKKSRHEFILDAAGEPTGMVLEYARQIMRPYMDQDLLGAFEDPSWLMPKVNANLAAAGVTSIQDPIVLPETIPHYEWLSKSGEMTFRMHGALLFYAKDESEGRTAEEIVAPEIAKLNKLRKISDGLENVTFSGLKVKADGILDGNPFSEPPTTPNAAMVDGFLQPYFDLDPANKKIEIAGYVDLESDLCKDVQANLAKYEKEKAKATFKEQHGYFPLQCIKQYGALMHREDVIAEAIKQGTEAGYNIHVHALGDKAVKLTTEAFVATKEVADKNGVTQAIAHMQAVKPEDVKTLGKLGASVVFTYIWITPTPEYHITVIPFINELQSVKDLFSIEHSYNQLTHPVKSLIDAGGVAVAGSDVPVLTRNPMPFVHMAQSLHRTGKNMDGSLASFNAEGESINIHEAIASFTINSARLVNEDKKVGSIEPGKRADMVVISQNVVEMAESGMAPAIAGTKVLTTVFDGKVVFEAK